MAVKSFEAIVKGFTKTISQLDVLISHNDVVEKGNQATINSLLETNGKLRNETEAAKTLKFNLSKLIGATTE